MGEHDQQLLTNRSIAVELHLRRVEKHLPHAASECHL